MFTFVYITPENGPRAETCQNIMEILNKNELYFCGVLFW
jgi:hypothetical protein